MSDEEEEPCQECDICGSHTQVEGIEIIRADGTAKWECTCDNCFTTGRINKDGHE